MSKKQGAGDQRPVTPVAPPPEIFGRRARWTSFGLLGAALVAVLVVYLPVRDAGWIYDDADYVLGDPRLKQPELFLPGHWSDPPPPALDNRGRPLFLQGYDKPAIQDRYLWRLSFVTERLAFGEPRPVVSHTINLLLHLACVAALFFALQRWASLYMNKLFPDSDPLPWTTLFPGLAALAFAVLPWASEPVVYVTARSGSMGALCVLAGAILCAVALEPGRAWWTRGLALAGALLAALAAYGCKENFITASAGYLLLAAPLVLHSKFKIQNSKEQPDDANPPRRSFAFCILNFAFAVLLLVAVAAWGIRSSDRAKGLWEQAEGGRGWAYFFEIQSPLVLQTLMDQLAGRKIGMESNHPMWPTPACWIALALNAILLLAGTLGGAFRPLLLGLGWFYLHLLPTNSFLPRPEFLSGRNVYLPAMGVAVLTAGVVLHLWLLLRAHAGPRRWVPVVLGAMLLIHWGTVSGSWARAFADPLEVWERSARVAPDHATVRLNVAGTLAKKARNGPLSPDDKRRIEEESKAVLAAENSPTMAYHTERPKALRRARAYRTLGQLARDARRWKDAAQHFRQGFEQEPTPEIWLDWINLATDANDNTIYTEAYREGERQWPGAWWLAAARANAAMARGLPAAPFLKDFERAEAEPDVVGPELRNHQATALFNLAQVVPERNRAWALHDRIARLGVAPQDLEKIRKLIETRFGKRSQ